MQSMPDASAIAEGVGPTADMNLLPMAFGGHCYYVRKCVTGETSENGERQINGILLPDCAIENSFWAEVVGIGPNVTKPANRLHMHRFKRARCFDGHAEVGDLVLMPPEDQGIKRAPWCAWEYFVEESVPRAIYKQAVA